MLKFTGLDGSEISFDETNIKKVMKDEELGCTCIIDGYGKWYAVKESKIQVINAIEKAVDKLQLKMAL
jgi:uncharacterized protein YlzI (FlbEa/FlbD family)